MAKVPIYDSQVGLSSQPAAQMRSLEQEKQFGKDLQLAGKTARDLATVLQNAEDYTQTLTKKNEITSQLNTLDSKAKQDPIYNNSQAYQDELQKIKDVSTEGFTNNIARQQFSEWSNNEIAKQAISINSYFFDKTVKHTQGELIRYEREAKEKYVNELNEKRAASAKQVYLTELAKAFNVGYVNEVFYENALTKVDKWDSERQDTQLQDLMNTNIEMAEKAVLDGTYGKMTPDDRASWLKLIESAKSQREADIKKEYAAETEAKDDSYVEKYFNDELTIADLNAGIKQDETTGGPTRETLLKMRDRLFSAQKESLKNLLKNSDKGRQLSLLIDKTIDKKVDLIRAREILIDAYGDGIIDKTEAQTLGKIKKALQDIRFNKDTSPHVAALKAIKAAFGKSNKSTTELDQDLREYLYAAAEEGADEKKIADDIKKRRQNSNFPQFEEWQLNMSYQYGEGPVKMLNVEDDGMPFVERLDAK